MCVCVCVSGQVSHESWEPAFLCAVLNPHGIDLISGLAVPRLSQSHCYSVCVCVGESVCLRVHTYLFIFFPSFSSCGNFYLLFSFLARIFLSVSRFSHCILPSDRLDRCSRLPCLCFDMLCDNHRREVGKDYKRMRCTQGTGSPDGPSFDHTDIINSHTHTHTCSPSSLFYHAVMC